MGQLNRKKQFSCVQPGLLGFFVTKCVDTNILWLLNPLHTEYIFFLVQTIRKKYIFGTADWEWVLSHRMWISHYKKATLSIFRLMLIFLNFQTANTNNQGSCAERILHPPQQEHPRTSDYEIFLPLWSPCQISGIKTLLVWPWPAIIQDPAQAWQVREPCHLMANTMDNIGQHWRYNTWQPCQPWPSRLIIGLNSCCLIAALAASLSSHMRH